MMKFCHPAATVPAPTSCPSMKSALGMTPQRSRMARTIPTKAATLSSAIYTFYVPGSDTKRVVRWAYLARMTRRWQIWWWGTSAPVRTAWAGHLLRKRRWRGRRETGWRRSCRWLWYTGILHLCCKDTKTHLVHLQQDDIVPSVIIWKACSNQISYGFWQRWFIHILNPFITFFAEKTVSLNLMTFPAILQEQLEMQPVLFPSLKESIKPVCPCPSYFRMHLINRQTCLYFKVSPPFYLLCIQESLSEASAVTILITPTQYRALGWLRAYK